MVERLGSSHLPVLQWVPLLTGERPLDENLPQKDGGAAQAKPKGGTATKTNVATASGPKPGAGRVTPPGSRPAASRKKKKRK